MFGNSRRERSQGEQPRTSERPVKEQSSLGAPGFAGACLKTGARQTGWNPLLLLDKQPGNKFVARSVASAFLYAETRTINRS